MSLSVLHQVFSPLRQGGQFYLILFLAAVLPLVFLCLSSAPPFFAFAYYGGLLPVSWSISHAGMNVGDIINGFYNDASGFFGIPLDVRATYIVLFTI